MTRYPVFARSGSRRFAALLLRTVQHSARLAAYAVASCFFACTAASAAADARPNIIVIMADDLGYGDLSCYDGWIQTPHLDALAEQGVRLTDFHSSGNVCSPTRAGLLTGRYQQRTGITGVVFADPTRTAHYHGLQPQERTFAEMLGEQGYRTAIFGKWHLGYLPQYNPTKHGFETFRGYVSGNVDFFSHIDQAGNADWWQQTRLEDEEGYTTHLITDHAVDFIEAHRDEPFCLYLPHEAPHAPYQGPSDQPLRTVGGNIASAGDRDDVKRAYREMVQAMDDGVGRILQTLREQQLDRKTLVMFFSDNGANRRGSNGSLRGHKGSNWEGGHRVPFIAAWPGRIPAGKESDALTLSIDVLPTMLDAAGVGAAKDLALDGISLMPVLSGQRTPQPRQVFWNGKAMRDGRWKLILDGKGGDAVGLYDLQADLGEQRNLAETMPDRVAQMQDALAAWQQSITATATAQPDVQPPDQVEEYRDWDTAAFALDNLVAWCIVPFDAAKRSPAQRAQMLNRLGIRRVAYDWRQEHVAEFEEEIRQYLKHGLEYFAFWDWHDAIEPLIRTYGLQPQIWKTNPSPEHGTDEQKKLAAVEKLLPLVEKTRSLGCELGLYNHGGWGGQPDNLVAVCEHLRSQHDASHVGIVYNFHHGHDDIDRFAEVFQRLEPYLLCVNINGMASAEEVAADTDAHKILSVGQGRHEAAMLRVIAESGYRGPLAIIGHRSERDVEECLRESLEGLQQIVEKL